METQIPILYPTMEDMKSFITYVEKLERWGVDRFGIAKIIPPTNWTPRPKDPNYEEYYTANYEIRKPILLQSFEATKHEGFYYVCADKKAHLSSETVPSWRTINSNRATQDISDEEYWSQMDSLRPLYGADVAGSMFDPEVNQWNPGHLFDILWHTHSIHGPKVDGLYTPSLYFGSAASTFACHTEDNDLGSLNYLHWGAKKNWTAVPPAYNRQVEDLIMRLCGKDFKRCAGVWRHKIALIKPEVLRNVYNIPCGEVR